MLPTRKSVPRSSRQLDHMKIWDRKETQTAVVWSCFPFIRSGQNHLARHSGREKKTRQTEEEVRRQHQGMDRPGVRQVPEGSGEQGKWRKMVAKSSVMPQRPSRLRYRSWWWWWWPLSRAASYRLQAHDSFFYFLFWFFSSFFFSCLASMRPV